MNLPREGIDTGPSHFSRHKNFRENIMEITMKKTTLILAILTSSAIVLTACGAQTEADNATPAAVTPPALIAEGRLYPANTLDQSFAFPGQVAEVLVQDGDLVAAGQPLARLTASPETELALANAQLVHDLEQLSKNDFEKAANEVETTDEGEPDMFGEGGAQAAE